MNPGSSLGDIRRNATAPGTTIVMTGIRNRHSRREKGARIGEDVTTSLALWFVLSASPPTNGGEAMTPMIDRFTKSNPEVRRFTNRRAADYLYRLYQGATIAAALLLVLSAAI
jgi:hypothetical protein